MSALLTQHGSEFKIGGISLNVILEEGQKKANEICTNLFGVPCPWKMEVKVTSTGTHYVSYENGFYNNSNTDEARALKASIGSILFASTVGAIRDAVRGAGFNPDVEVRASTFARKNILDKDGKPVLDQNGRDLILNTAQVSIGFTQWAEAARSRAKANTPEAQYQEAMLRYLTVAGDNASEPPAGLKSIQTQTAWYNAQAAKLEEAAAHKVATVGEVVQANEGRRRKKGNTTPPPTEESWVEGDQPSGDAPF